MALFNRRRRRVEVRVEAGKRLTVVRDDGSHAVFGPGDVLPAWLLERAAELVAAGRLTFEEVE